MEENRNIPEHFCNVSKKEIKNKKTLEPEQDLLPYLFHVFISFADNADPSRIRLLLLTGT